MTAGALPPQPASSTLAVLLAAVLSGAAATMPVVAHPRMYDDDDPLLARLRPICLALPESTERESHGRPNFFAGKRVFAAYGVAGDNDHRLIIRPDESERAALAADARFTVPPYLGPSGWLALDLAAEPDWDEVAELVEASYRRVASARMLRELAP